VTTRLCGALACALLLVGAAGCGGGGKKSAGITPPVSTTTGGGGTQLKVGLVTDVGGLNDRSFNHLAYLGLQRAQSRLGVSGRVLESRQPSDYIPNLSSLARQHYDLIVAVGALMADATDAVATEFPKTRFAIVDFSQAALKHSPKNVHGLVFKEQEAGYLVGYLAGLLEKDKAAEAGKANTIGSVGGQKLPPVDHYIAGYQAGAKAADPGITLVNGYSQDFVDPAKCKELALAQIGQGSDIEFQVAGGCGLGVLDAARTKGVWGIGVDADQSYLGPHVLTSALKKVDLAVFRTIRQVKAGTFRGGADTLFDLKGDGVGIGRISPKVPAAYRAKVLQVAKDIASGKIANIPETVG
jgi:basic membrane protein A